MSNQLSELPLPLPDLLGQWLILNARFHVLVCSAGCQQALAPGGISRHLRDKHQVHIESRKLADQYIKQWQWPYTFQTVLLPPDGLAPQPGIPVFTGFQCLDCKYLTRNRHNMRNHGLIEHYKEKRLQDKELFQAVQLQTWFREKRARYWVVDDATRQSRDVNNSSSSGSGDAGAAIKAEIAEWMIKEEGQYQVSTVATEIDPWLQYTGWEEVLAGSRHNLETTAAFTATAAATEPELVRLLQSWERILQQSLNTHAAVSNYKDILKWWASPKNEVAS